MQRERLPKEQPINDDFIDDYEEDELSENYFCTECEEVYHNDPGNCNVCGGRIEEILDHEDEPVKPYVCMRCGSHYHTRGTCECGGEVI